MKKLLLCGVAALAITAAAAPAKAEGIDLGLGGYFIGYGLYNDQDEATGTSLRSTDFRKETEIHFNGETTLDNGLTVGAHVELQADRNDNTASAVDGTDSRIEESYMYLSGGWGRVNFGEEDGVAYLLQVAAPSADDNIDGLRPDINAFDLSAMSAGNFTGTGADLLTYAADATGYSNKLTYITPLFSGFQAGVSFTPSVSDAGGTSFAAASTDNNAGQFDNGIDLAARYQGVAGPVDVTVGAGYTMISTEKDAAGTTAVGTDDQTLYNAGVRLGYAGFGAGASYLNNNNGVDTNGDTRTWVAGVDYVTGPFKVGVSYYDRKDEGNAPVSGGTDDTDTTRWTAGVGYQYGPGMSLNGSVARVKVEDDATSGDGYQVAVGTRVDF